jgi:hypothetical protein
MAAAGGYVQNAIETTPNAQNNPSAVSATIFYHPLRDASWRIPVMLDDRSDELRGFADNVQQDVVGYDTGEWGANLRAYPNLMGLYLMACHGAPVTTAGNGVITDPGGTTIPAGATRHVWTAGTTNTAVRSLQRHIVYPDQSVFILQRGCIVEQIQMQADGEVMTFSASGHNLYSAQEADPALTATYDALTIKPFLRSMQGPPTTWLASSGTQTMFSWQLDNPVSYDRTLSGSMFPDVVDRTGVDLRLSATVNTRYLTTADITALLAGTGFTVKTSWVHTQFITGSYPYKLFIEGNAIYNDLQPDALQHQIRHGASIPVTFGRSSGGTPSYTITLVNGVASYSSVG